jgi:ethanolamine utilization protein EutN
MILGRVLGTVVATQKHYKVEGRKLLLVQPLDPHGKEDGPPLLSIDSVDAGEGDWVLVTTEGRSAAMALGRVQAPVDAAIVGVVDSVDLP